MKIMCKQEYYNQVVQYAESIKDTSLQNCMERLEAWEKNPDRPCEIELYHDWAPLSYPLVDGYISMYSRYHSVVPYQKSGKNV